MEAVKGGVAVVDAEHGRLDVRSLGNSGAPALVVDRGRLARELGHARKDARAQGSREEQNVRGLAAARPPLEFRLERIPPPREAPREATAMAQAKTQTRERPRRWRRLLRAREITRRRA